MTNRRFLTGTVAAGAVSLGAAFIETVSAGAALAQAEAPAGMSANDRLLQLGPEGEALAKRAGTWDVAFTSWDKPGAAPVTTGGFVAEREMIGPMLQEKLHTLPGAPGQAWTRLTTSSSTASPAAGITCRWTLAPPLA